ncbi:hypothetical protein AciX9_1769 [Granulicella tundricola MP5ACTX9]|uniref:DUF6980 domain-containing protein n=1 Tax=Granulicella tundricola (strain ATCC BAA-1859 / DSM 23138 / MP5ACTX9) TaxID=1198114 RepID=E8WZC9_GRATM|nr:hypothetical protein AciX9_1769 [Granulicella tundricola MP5ACTX9]
MNDHCCAMMSSNLAGGETAILYVPKFRDYGIPVLDGGGSFIAISHCPWCGQTLPHTLRDRWFTEIEARGFEIGDDNIPVEFATDAWWKASA